MEDEKIVELYWDRNESAIDESSKKYGSYCTSIAVNILYNPADAEECVSDTWLRAWNAMPPHKPSVLSAFLGKITRNLSFDLYKKLHREKRGGHSIDLSLEELEGMVSGNDDPVHHYEAAELSREIDAFLMGLPKDKRCMFVRRYWYVDGLGDIAKRFGISENNAAVTLSRIRNSLRSYLLERGYSI